MIRIGITSDRQARSNCDRSSHNCAAEELLMTQAAARSESLGHPHKSSDGSGALAPAKVGMVAFLATEAAFFGTLIMAYVYFLGQTSSGEPNPRQVFRLPLVLAASACLFSSSATIHLAERALGRNARRAFLGWWGL